MAALNSSRRLKATSSVQSMSNALSFQPAPLTSAALSRSVEEDLESQARSSLSLFGFGTLDSVNWSPVSASAAAAAATTDTPGTGGAIKVRVMERVCPIGTNAFLWNTMNSGESVANGSEGADDMASSSADLTTVSANGTSGGGVWDVEGSDLDAVTSAAGLGSVFASKVLQQYLVKCYQGNLSIKWVVGDKPSRMFASRTTYCLLDYECILVNDWDENADPSPMYVRTMQSCYSPQCQPWLDEVGSKPTDLQPTGFMAQLPMAARRAKLRALCAKIARLEEVRAASPRLGV
ncbi:hypothetical protein BBO99_00005541 [Phytophthora kernoviae]|uniref:Uncharacterized protein n=2 Tax=Phytophthora kernoviae TaxID=325452 RepID=A0A3R7NFC3_9STRA|nr:hypothetical protein G195_009843 [Phytophthora kernoviae 00238/432]KAG2526833.1 hypothetical protein JM16_003673 [Phytophthora kernoviae]KAG2527077.1 hypothetical protein JM18_003181 [Phytophthora kernoviae]RLN27145.1 hypothetical protein BBI17_003766 [Phytophthora kernoviae]RLN79044.1 hypothetical protein BBO99_00005541 [Phytophthora kernoviae]